MFHSLCKARSLMKDGAIPYADAEVLFNDGKTEGKETLIYNSNRYTYVGGVINPDSISRLTVFDGENYHNVFPEHFKVEKMGYADHISCDVVDVYCVVIYKGSNSYHGTYLLNESFAHTRSVTIETLVPPETKYLELMGPKTIDLSAYDVQMGSGVTASINDVIASGFIAGGLLEICAYNGTFWDDVNTNRPLRFMLSVGQPVMVDGCTVVRVGNGDVCQVALAATIMWTDASVKNVKIIIAMTGDGQGGIAITVQVT